MGIVSDYELREAARFTARNWEQWLALDNDERALSVAHMRVHQALEANVHDAYQQHSEAQARRARRRGRR